MWLMQHTRTDAFWSNSLGWTEDGSQAEAFTFAQVQAVNLPMEGKWFLYARAVA